MGWDMSVVHNSDWEIVSIHKPLHSPSPHFPAKTQLPNPPISTTPNPNSMRGGAVQINWHDVKPVLTLDFHPTYGQLATGGADYDIKLWDTNSGEEEKKSPGVSYRTSLSHHSSAVNVLRFSRSGEQLASGADGGELMLWKSHSRDAGQVWKVLKSLLFHRKDVLDLQWSKDDAYLISGSVDNSCIIWNVNKGSVHQILDSHAHYVQGVAWDPLAKYAASLSSDRTCRIYVNKPSKTKGTEKMNYVCQHTISRVEPQTSEETKPSRNHLFHDETLPSFFRRLEWSPDGSFLLVPAGIYKLKTSAEAVNTAYIFSRRDLSRPALMLPGASKPVLAVRFCPLTFKLRGSKPSATFFKLPYRFIFAVATINSVYIYDTESVQPIAVVAGIHYAAVTDIAWSPTGKYLALSSHDGYCTLLEFESGELGLTISSLEPVEILKNEDKMSIDKQEDFLEVTPKKKSDDARCHEMAVEVVEQAETTQNNTSSPMDVEVVEGHKTTDKDAGIVESRDMQLQAGKQGAKANASDPKKPARKRIIPVAID